MSAQLTWLAYITIMTAFFWVPNILDSFLKRGIMGTLGNPQDQSKPLSAWAIRAKAAHYNAVENLVIVAVLILIAEIRGADVSTLAMVYFFARLGHFAVYTAGIPAARTVLFLTGWALQILIFCAIL